MNDVAQFITQGTSAWAIASGLLSLWQASGEVTSPERQESKILNAWLDLSDIVDEHLGSGETIDNPDIDNQALLGVVVDFSTQHPHLSPAQTAHAVATGIDSSRHASFTRSWLQERPANFELAPNDLVPIRETPFFLGDEHYCSRPHRLGIADNELDHIRPVRQSRWSIEMHIEHAAAVDALADGPLSVAVVLPNETKDDFIFAADPNERSIVVSQSSAGAQNQRLSELLELVRDQADIVVFPELVAGPATWEPLGETMGEAGRVAVLVPGSFHDASTGRRLNHSGIMLRNEGMVADHYKFEPFTTRQNEREGIEVEIPARLHILAGERVRLAVLICKDALSAGAVEELAHVGVNLLLVPAMSDRITDFEAAATVLRRYSQGSLVVANTPRRPIEDEDVAHGLIGQPARNHPIIETWAPQPAPGASIFELGSQQSAYSALT